MQINHPVRTVIVLVIAFLGAGSIAFTAGLFLQGTSWFGVGADVAGATQRSLDNAAAIQQGVSTARKSVDSSLDRIRADRNAVDELIARYSGDQGGSGKTTIPMAAGNGGAGISGDGGAVLPSISGSQSLLEVVLKAAWIALAAAIGAVAGWWIGRSTLVAKQTKARLASRTIGSDGATVNPQQEFSRVHYD